MRRPSGAAPAGELPVTMPGGALWPRLRLRMFLPNPDRFGAAGAEAAGGRGLPSRRSPRKTAAREAGLPLPTAYHLLRTLTHEDYLRREKGVFVLGDAVGRLASAALSTIRNDHFSPSISYAKPWQRLLSSLAFSISI